MSDGKTVWRVGRKLGRTLYKNDVCIGMVDDAETANLIVTTMNEYNASNKKGDEKCSG